MPPIPQNSDHPRAASVIIVGAGPAGIGLARTLKKQGIGDVVLLEAREVGASFRAWPDDTRFLTPSFPANAYGCPDLNSVAACHSPGGDLGSEHPAGEEYAGWLARLAAGANLNIVSPVEVRNVRTAGSEFELSTSDGMWTCDTLVWATGEFFFPNRAPFAGAELGIHYTGISSWAQIGGQHPVIIGGAESGIDAACHLIRLGKTVTVLDKAGAWIPEQGDPSQVLAPQTRSRLREALASGRLDLIPDITVRGIQAEPEGFRILSEDGRAFLTDSPPILCTGFQGGASQIEELWDWKHGQIQLTGHDESTRTPGLFLVGPQVRHPGEIFCYIYKFRTRFPVVAERIAKRSEFRVHAESPSRCFSERVPV